MKHGSLFSGIGGFDLAAEWMGWKNLFHCEWNPFGQRVLNHYWPDAESFTDITKTDFTKYANTIDVLSGGFPCQPYSTAGKRLGKEDKRHLWPEMLRAIREVSPRWVVGENVRGLVSWNGGLVFDEVQSDLEACGYEVIPYLLPACAVNAPHRRERVWFVAYRNDQRQHRVGSLENNTKQGKQTQLKPCDGFEQGIASDTCREQLQGSEQHRSFTSEGPFKTQSRQFSGSIPSAWEEFPTEPPLCIGDDGLSGELDGITFSKWRTQSIIAAGNAIVPQIALQIFKTIQQYEKDNTNIF